jgi:hypothetical protein
MGIIHYPVFYLKHDVSETEICLRLQAEPSQLGLIELVCLRTYEDGDRI